MARKQHKPEEIVAKLRQVEVLLAQGKSAVEAVRTLGVTEQTYYRWRAEYGGLKLDQVRRLKQLEQENGRLRRAVADLTLENLVLTSKGAIGVAQGDEGSGAARGLQQRDASVAIVQVGRQDGSQQQAAISVHQRVALAPDHTFRWVVAAPPSNAGAARASGLGMHHRSRGRGVAPGPLAVGHRRRVGHALEGATAGQAQKPAQGGLPGREVARQIPPGAAGPQHIEHAVQ